MLAKLVHSERKHVGCGSELNHCWEVCWLLVFVVRWHRTVSGKSAPTQRRVNYVNGCVPVGWMIVKWQNKYGWWTLRPC